MKDFICREHLWNCVRTRQTVSCLNGSTKQDCLVSIYFKFSRLPSGKQWHICSHSHPHFIHLFTCTKEFKRYCLLSRFTTLNIDIIITHTLSGKKLGTSQNYLTKAYKKLQETTLNEKKKF